METNLNNIDTILIFQETRSHKNNLKKGALQLILETMNTLIPRCRSDYQNAQVSINTCLTMPLTTIFKDWEADESLNYLGNPTAKRSTVQDFFKLNHNQTALEYKTREECKSSQLLFKIKRDHTNNRLRMQEFFTNLLLPNNATPVQPRTTSLAQHFKHDHITIWKCKNKSIRQLLVNNLPLIMPKDYNKTITRRQWKAFYTTPMHQSPRNVWLKIIYNKIPSNSFLYQSRVKDIENDRCKQCNEREDARHMLMDCGIKLDVWEAIFKAHISYPKEINTHRIFKDIQNLTLDRYFIYNLDLKINIFDFFATIIKVIWTNHYFVHYRNITFDPESVIKSINRELDKLSSMESVVL